MKHIPVVNETYPNTLDSRQDIHVDLNLDMIKYYGHRWWDTSTLSEFFEQSLETYTAANPKEESIPLHQYQN